jgi:hypothetical protein
MTPEGARHAQDRQGAAMSRPQFIPLPVVALIDVLHRAWDGVDDLACRGYLDPDWENWQDIPLGAVIELASLAASCAQCRIGPSALAEHWINLKQWQYQEEHERSLPTWTCDCGHLYKVELTRAGAPREFYEPCGDGLLGPLCAAATQPDLGECPHGSCPDIAYDGNYLLGERAGVITTTSKGKVKHSDRCPACGEQFAGVIARRNDPQQQLFDIPAPRAGQPTQRGRPHPGERLPPRAPSHRLDAGQDIAQQRLF